MYLRITDQYDKPIRVFAVGPQAEAVSRYIYDAFYSREARLRNHPPRVELVRLTNRQYLNTVADLIKHFTGDDKLETGEHGLAASYRSRQGKGDDNRKSFERVDRQIVFSFAEDNPDSEKLGRGTNEISITWHGSLIAQETGDYEFVA